MEPDIVGRAKHGPIPAGVPCDGDDLRLVVEEQGSVAPANVESAVDGLEEPDILLGQAEFGAVEDAVKAVLEAQPMPEMARAEMLLPRGYI